jgi:hypothetical protein
LRLLVPEHPRNLSALRISVTAILLASPETYSAERIAALPSALLTAPEGLAWAMHTIPITPALARAAHWVLVGSLVSGLVGFWSRLSLALVTFSGLYVLGLFQLTGSVTHDMHLLWFAALLALGPCGEALSVDRLLAKRRGAPAPAPSVRAAVPLLFMRILLGLVYFFPGFWKLRESGLAWITSDNLKNQMYWKWYENGAVPLWRVDRSQSLLLVGALGVVLLELSFPLLVLLPKTRPLAAIGGLLFHAFSRVFLFIPFVSLWGCYTMLIDWSPQRPPFGNAAGGDTTTGLVVSSPLRWPLGTRAAAIVGTALVLVVTLRGAQNHIQAWPFACYPTFQWRVGAAIPDLVMEAVRADGTTQVLPDGPGAGGRRTQDDWGTAWRVAGLYGEMPSVDQFRAYLAHARRKPALDAALGNAVAIRFYRAWYSVRPGDAGRPPERAEPILEIPLR